MKTQLQLIQEAYANMVSEAQKQLDELSKDTLNSYINKASKKAEKEKDLAINWHGLDSQDGNDSLKKSEKISRNVSVAAKKVQTKNSDISSPFTVNKNTILYHVTPFKFNEFRDENTWFTPHKSEADTYKKNQNLNNRNARIITANLSDNHKIASPEETAHYANKIWPAEKLDYSMFDKEIGEYHPKDIDKFVNSLKSNGFHGAVHPDYAADNKKDSHTLVIFNPKRSISIKDHGSMS